MASSSPPPPGDFDLTAEEVEAFFSSRPKRYQDFDCKELWDIVRYDFKHWTLDLLNTVDMSLLIQLRDNLLSGGVYVIPQDDTHSYADAIAFVLNESSPALWTLEAMREVQASNHPFRSRTMLLKLGLTPTSDPVHQLTSTATPVAIQTITSPLYTAQQQHTFPQELTVPAASPIPPAAPAPPADQPDFVPQTNITYLIFNFPKVFPDKNKYSGTGRSLEYTLQSFYETAQSVGFPAVHYYRILPRILEGAAYTYYLNNNLKALSFDQACDHLRGYFEGFYFQLSALEKWNEITLAGVVADNPDKSIGDCLTLMVNQLQEHQFSLNKDLQTPTFLHQKINLACRTVEACHSVLNHSQKQLGPFISSLQTAISNYTSLIPTPTSSDQTYFPDRRCCNSRPSVSQYRESSRKSSTKHCCACGKEDCRSWKHPVAERQALCTPFNRKFSDRYPDKRTDIDKHFRQYVNSCEEPDSPDGNLEDVVEYTVPQSSQIFFTTSFGPVSQANVLSTLDNLNNRIFSHRLTADAPPDVPVAATDASDPNLLDPDAAYQSTLTPRYNSTHFHGIMIDTSASNRSTAGFGQFQALQHIKKDITINTSTAGQVDIQLGIGTTSSLGSLQLHTPMGTVEFHVVHADTPFILSLADMDQLKLRFDNLQNILHMPTGTIQVVRKFGHPFVVWNTSLAT